MPFAPGTLYQMCMVDKSGNSGGCQDTYAVIAPTSTPSSSCSNSTLHFPDGPLDVEVIGKSGIISQFGWIDQVCLQFEWHHHGPLTGFTVFRPSIHTKERHTTVSTLTTLKLPRSSLHADTP